MTEIVIPTWAIWVFIALTAVNIVLRIWHIKLMKAQTREIRFSTYGD